MNQSAYVTEALAGISEKLKLLPDNVTQSTNLKYAGGAIVLLVLLALQLRGGDKAHFKSTGGQKMKYFSDETRFTRFTQGRELSERGRKVAGDDPYLIRNGRHRELVISSPKHMSEFLKKDYQDHTKAHNMNWGDYVGQLLGQCVGQQSGAKWKTMRSHFDPDFSAQSATRMIPGFAAGIQRWAKELPERAMRSGLDEDGFSTDVMRECKLLAFRLISLMLYGEAFDDKMFEKLVEMSHLHHKIMGVGIFGRWNIFSWYNKLPTADRLLLDTYKREWRQFNLAIIGRARMDKLSCPAARIYEGVEQREMSAEETLDEILFANIDITGSVLANLLSNIARDTGFQQRLRLEVERERAAAGQSFSISTYASKQDSLLHYATLESLRVTPSVQFSPPECTGAEKHIAGYLVPAGTPVIVDIRRLNTHPSLWGPDPDVFRPERFLKLSPTQWRHGLLRFGIGPGRCLGKNMADLLLKMVTLQTLDSFDMRMPTRNDAQKAERGFAMANAVEVELRPLKTVAA